MSAGAGLVFHGTGFYITDYGKDGKKDQKTAPGRKTDPKPDSAAESKPAESAGAESRSAEAKTEASSEREPCLRLQIRQRRRICPVERTRQGSRVTQGLRVNFADRIRAELKRAALTIGAPEDIEPLLERPRDPLLADWASNIAMVLARPLRRKPAELAAAIRDAINLADAGVASVEIAGPGFLNFRLDPVAVAETLREIVSANENYGRGTVGAHCPVVVEFVSANPTGPLHVGHGRQAALGDAISALLEWTGWHVSREFYYNDAGVQIDNLELSVRAHLDAAGGAATIPEGGYHGEYMREIAERYDASARDEPP